VQPNGYAENLGCGANLKNNMILILDRIIQTLFENQEANGTYNMGGALHISREDKIYI
jgi:hypothetical protein